MNRDDCISFFKQWLVKCCILFLISSMLFCPCFILADTKDRVDQNLECFDQLISIPSINTSRNVIINTSGAGFKEKYYPNIDDLQRHLEYLGTIKYINGITRFMITLMLVTNEGQLDLLRSAFAVNVNRQYSMSDETHVETYQDKYSFFDMFNTASLKIGVIGEHSNLLQVLRYMRLAIMEAFPETFLDFVNGRALFYSNNTSFSINGRQSFLGPENNTQRRPFFNALIRDLSDIERDINREDQKHEEIARDIMRPFRENSNNRAEINAKTQDLIDSRRLTSRMADNGYERDHFRNSMLNGRVSQVVNAFRENGSILSSYD